MKLNKQFKIVLFSIIFLSLATYSVYSQFEATIKINGQIFSENSRTIINNAMVINKRTGTGTFVSLNGAFSVSIGKEDTLLIHSNGYSTKKICYKDSAYKANYTVTVYLKSITYSLKEVEIHPIKKLNEIEKEIKKIGVKDVGTYKNVSAISSPITALYMRFSKIEKSKRKVAELENEDFKRSILKDLFRTYIAYDIINLSDDEFDDFISYMNLQDEFIANATQYELVSEVKSNFLSYKSVRKPK